MIRTAAALLALAARAGCRSEAPATATVPDRLTFATARPGEAPAKARKALARLAPDGSNGRRHGIVLAVTPDDTWYARVLTRQGVVVLSRGYGCDEYQDNEWWRLRAAPGDAVAWTGGSELCPSEFGVTEIGTAA